MARRRPSCLTRPIPTWRHSWPCPNARPSALPRSCGEMPAEPVMDERIQSALRLLPDYLARHVLLSASALALGIILGLPLGLWLVRHPRLRWSALAAASFVQTVPGLALLALFYPLLLGLSAFTDKLLGFRIPALGFLPSLLALTLYAMLPVLRNAVAG